jgi:hypothetical protein
LFGHGRGRNLASSTSRSSWCPKRSESCILKVEHSYNHAPLNYKLLFDTSEERITIMLPHCKLLEGFDHSC